MLKYYGVFLVRKVAYEHLDSLKEKLRRILKHPGLVSSLPWNAVRFSFLVVAFLLGMALYTVINTSLSFLGLQDINATTMTMVGLVIVPITTLGAYSVLKKHYFRVPGEVHEMNTFLVALGEYKNKNVKTNSKTMKNVEQKVSKNLKSYHEQILSLIYNEMKNDLDIKAFRRDYEKISSLITKNSGQLRMPKKLDLWQKSLADWGQKTYSFLLKKGNLWIWQDQEQKSVIFNLMTFDSEPSEYFGKEKNDKRRVITFTAEIKDEHHQILHYLDEITISAFFPHHHSVSSELVKSLDKLMPQISTSLTSWTQTLTTYFNDNNESNFSVTDEMNIFEASIHDPLADLTLLMITKLSGNAEILLQQARQKEHMTTLTREFLTILENRLDLPFSNIMREIFTSVFELIPEAEKQAEMLRAHANQLIQMSMKLRDVQSLVRNLQTRGLIENPTLLESFMTLLESFLPFYQELEKIRFLSQWFEDIEHYTVLPDEVALESGTEEIELTGIPKESILIAKNLFKQYQGAAHTVYALRGVSLQVKEKEFVIITGPSGSGKTTLLNVLSGLDLPDRGVVILDGQDITKMNQKQLTDLRRDKIGFIFQFYNLLPVLNAQENVSYPREIKGEVLSARQRARQLLEHVGLGRFLRQTPNKLSGGQMQRVTIARSLQNIPKIIFADEPTGDLDHVTGEKVMELLRKFHQDGHTVILVTHDLSLLKYCTRWIEMRDGQIIRDESLDSNSNEPR